MVGRLQTLTDRGQLRCSTRADEPGPGAKRPHSMRGRPDFLRAAAGCLSAVMAFAPHKVGIRKLNPAIQ